MLLCAKIKTWYESIQGTHCSYKTSLGNQKNNEEERIRKTSLQSLPTRNVVRDYLPKIIEKKKERGISWRYAHLTLFNADDFLIVLNMDG